MSYLQLDGSSYSCGNLEHITDVKIDNIYAVMDVAKDVEKQNGYKRKTVVITSITLLEDNRSLWEKIKNYL